jgi:hypothetical protein
MILIFEWQNFKISVFNPNKLQTFLRTNSVFSFAEEKLVYIIKNNLYFENSIVKTFYKFTGS